MKKQFTISELERLIEGVRFTNERIYCPHCEGAGVFSMLPNPYKCEQCHGVGWGHNLNKIVLDEDVQFKIASQLIESQSILNIIEMAKVSGHQEVILSFDKRVKFEFVGGLRGKIKEAFWLFPRDIIKLDLK